MELPWDIYDHVLENQTRKFYIKLGPIKQIHGNLVTELIIDDILL